MQLNKHMVTVKQTKLRGVKIVLTDTFQDIRGLNTVLYKEDEYQDNGVRTKFIQDNISISSKNVLRGIHGDDKTWKLVTCLFGKIFFVVVNCNQISSDFGKWESFELANSNCHVLIPPGYGNAHLALSDFIVFHYKLSEYYDLGSQFTYYYNDPRFNINWPINNPVLQQRDSPK